MDDSLCQPLRTNVFKQLQNVVSFYPEEVKAGFRATIYRSYVFVKIYRKYDIIDLFELDLMVDADNILLPINTK